MARAGLSACVITYNEERNLAAALESVAFAEEIIVVDSHSSDGTRDVAESFARRHAAGGPRLRLLERDWPGHIEQKNFAVSQAANEWVLSIDADERVSPELRQEVEAALSREDADGYAMPRRTYYLGRWIRRGGWYPDLKLRLFRRSRGKWGGTNPHDHVDVVGKVRRLRGHIEHLSYRDIAEHVAAINFLTDVAAREKLLSGVRFPLARMVLHPPSKFLKMYLLQQGFREGTAGLIVAGLGTLYVFLKYAKLWELRRTAGGGIPEAPPRPSA